MFINRTLSFRFCHSVFVSRCIFLAKRYVRRHCMDIQVSTIFIDNNKRNNSLNKSLFCHRSEFKLLLYSNKIENEKKKFIIYSVYAWSCSIGITIFTAIAEFTNLFGELLKPNFGVKTCWFYSEFYLQTFL